MLDDKADKFGLDFQDYVTDSIYIGKANFLKRKLNMTGIADAKTIKKANELIAMQSDTKIKMRFHILGGNKKVKWKVSSKKEVQFEISTVKGLDV